MSPVMTTQIDMPYVPEQEEGGAGLFMYMFTLIILALMVYMWVEVYKLYTDTMPPAAATDSYYQKQIDDFRRNINYMIGLSVAMSVVFLFLLYKIM